MEFPRYMFGTTAIHQRGDISREAGDLCRIEREEGDDYIGAWVTGFGFIEVRFPKATTRALTEAEIEHWDGQGIAINSSPAIPLRIRGRA